MQFCQQGFKFVENLHHSWKNSPRHYVEQLQLQLNIRNSLPQRDDSTVHICLNRIVGATDHLLIICVKAIHSNHEDTHACSFLITCFWPLTIRMVGTSCLPPKMDLVGLAPHPYLFFV